MLSSMGILPMYFQARAGSPCYHLAHVFSDTGWKLSATICPRHF